MTREPAKKLPQSIIHGRDLINELAQDGLITLQTSNQFWSAVRVNSFPFDLNLSFERDSQTFLAEVIVGRLFDTSGTESLINLPIPINYKYSVDVLPVFSVEETYGVTESTNKTEMWNFLHLTVVKTLMATHTLLVTDSFDNECKQRIEAWGFPRSQEIWDYYAIGEAVLKGR